MRYLKTRKDSDALAYQRHIAKPLKSRARVMNVAISGQSGRLSAGLFPNHSASK
mgnify:CR=1 FL=1